MENFAIRPMTWPVLQLFSRNPLIRTSDRIQSAVTTLAVLVVIVAAGFAAILGMTIRDNETQNYLEQARTRHAVVAKAIEDSNPAILPDRTAFTVYARWNVNGVEHSKVLAWEHAVKAGDSLQIWTDDNGNRVDRPTPLMVAAKKALAIALVGWLIVAAAVAQVVMILRAHMNRMRNVHWERELRSLVDGEGGRTNSSQ